MLEEIAGEGYGDAIIDEMTTGVVSYSTDDSKYYNTRIELGNLVEAAVNGELPQPPADVERGDIDGNGTITMVDLFKMKLFIKQTANPTEEEQIAADINGDGKINLQDSFELKYRIAKGYWRT